jgi:hypothetical protein
MCGTAKKRTDTSIDTMSSGRVSTASAVHSRRPAREGAGVKVWCRVMVRLSTICV